MFRRPHYFSVSEIPVCVPPLTPHTPYTHPHPPRVRPRQPAPHTTDPVPRLSALAEASAAAVLKTLLKAGNPELHLHTQMSWRQLSGGGQTSGGHGDPATSCRPRVKTGGRKPCQQTKEPDRQCWGNGACPAGLVTQDLQQSKTPVSGQLDSPGPLVQGHFLSFLSSCETLTPICTRDRYVLPHSPLPPAIGPSPPIRTPANSIWIKY